MAYAGICLTVSHILVTQANPDGFYRHASEPHVFVRRVLQRKRADRRSVNVVALFSRIWRNSNGQIVNPDTDE